MREREETGREERKQGGGVERRRREGRREGRREEGRKSASPFRCYFYKQELLRSEILDLLILSGLDAK